jgi:hypothetical protein
VPVFIIVNTLVLAADKYPADESYERMLEDINFGFYFFFLFEVIVKSVGLGTKAFLQDGYNIFDSLIVFISSIDAIIQVIVISQ